MASDQKALALREQQLVEAEELLTAKHGAQSETVGLIRTRLQDVRAQMKEEMADHSGQESHTGNILTVWGAPQAKDATVMFVILGAVLIFAFGGMSTLFVLMMAAKW